MGLASLRFFEVQFMQWDGEDWVKNNKGGFG